MKIMKTKTKSTRSAIETEPKTINEAIKELLNSRNMLVAAFVSQALYEYSSKVVKSEAKIRESEAAEHARAAAMGMMSCRPTTGRGVGRSREGGSRQACRGGDQKMTPHPRTRKPVSRSEGAS
jgi:hypothetical protein